MKYPSTKTCALLSAGVLMVSQIAGFTQTLTHRYSFNDTAGSQSFLDSVGGPSWTGNLVGPSILDGSQLVMNGDGGFGSMPGAMISGLTQVTIEFWASYRDLNPVWTRTFFFGSQTAGGTKESGLDYCHYAGGDWQNLDISSPAGGAYVNNPGGINGLTNVHVTVVVDPPNNRMYYYNGTTLRSNPGLAGGTGVPALSTITDTFGVIGKSPFDVDPTLNATVDEFRVYNGVLSPSRIALNQAAGPDVYLTDPGTLQAVRLVSPESTLVVNQISPLGFRGDFSAVNDVDLVLYGGGTFTSGNTGVLTVSTNGVVTAVAPGTTTVVASYGGKSATNSFTVVSMPAVLKHRYSFTADATDSVSGANGTLQGEAVITGGKAVLNGANLTYVDLPGPQINLPSYKAVTIQAWVEFGNDLPYWCRLWDFGHSDASHEIYLAPKGPGNGAQYRGVSENFPGGQTIDWIGALTNQAVQLTAVIDPPTGTIAVYKNGNLEYARYDATAPLSLVSNTMAVLGRSLVAVDPFMPGSIDEFRIYNGALTPEEIALTYRNGVGSTNRDYGTLQSIEVQAVTYPANAGRMAPRIRANYSNLTAFDLFPNTSARVPGLVLTSSNTNVIDVLADNMIRTLSPGEATLTAAYHGKTSSTAVKVSNIAQLTHRYSFEQNFNDSVGTANGTPQGLASVAEGKLVLDGSDGTYLELPPGLLKGYPAVTIDTWVNLNAGNTWSRLWYFGDDRANEFYLAPIVLDGQQHWFSTGFPVDGTTITLPGRWENQSLHITCVYGDGVMAYYTNGVLHGILPQVNGRTDEIGTWFSWIGKSPYPDPYMNCTVDEFRVYNGRLSPQEIAASDMLGAATLLSTAAPHVAVTASSGQITLSWPAAAAGFSVQASGDLSAGLWTTLTNTPVLAGSNWQVTVPVSGTARFFRVWR